MSTSRTGLIRRNRWRIEIVSPMRLRSARSGVALVWVAIMGVMLICFVGLAMDAAVVYLAGSHLQIAADAAALAGAQFVRATEDDAIQPRTKAHEIALANKALGTPVSLNLNENNAEDGDIVIGRYFRFSNRDYYAEQGLQLCDPPPCFFSVLPESTSPNAVRVRARRTGTSDGHGQVPLVFGATPLINVTGVDVSRTATAMISGGTGAGMIILDDHAECSLQLGGNVTIDVTSAPGYDEDTAIQINSDDPCALCGNGNSLELRAPETNIVGSDPGYCFNSTPTLDTIINPDSITVPDPLAGLDPPPIGLNLGKIDPRTNDATYYPPGYYPGGMKISGSKKVLLGTTAPVPGIPGIIPSPGIYIVEGTANGSKGGFQATGGASVVATNVMIYLRSGKLDLGGGGNITITPMTEEINDGHDEYVSVAIFQARDNPTQAKITGNTNMSLQGTYYFPNNKLEVRGTGMALGNQLIAWQLEISGNGIFRIRYDGSIPSPGSKVFLVQ